MRWRKKIVQSSLLVLGEKLTTKTVKQSNFNSVSLATLLSVAFVPLTCGAELRHAYRFNIVQQDAALALTQFAEQADLTLIFSLDKVSNIKANKLQGYYSLKQAIKLLLVNTELIAILSQKGLLSIHNIKDIEKANSRLSTNPQSLAILASTALLKNITEQNISAENEVEKITITGIRGALGRAVDTKYNADGIVDSISAEDIGKFPDTNLAESLQRITGVSIDRSGGEGQKITVRGFGPQFNTVLVNGRQQASEDAGRDFSFDTLAAEMVNNLDVHKTAKATLQSGGIGSTINLQTAKPFAINGFKLAGSIKAIYDGNSEQKSPQASLFVSNTFNDDSFGVLFALSYLERETRLNRAQSVGWRENSSFTRGTPLTEKGQFYTGNIFIPQNFDSLVTTEKRERINGHLVLQYAPIDNMIVTLDTLYSDFDIRSDTTSYGHWFTSDNVENILVDTNGTVTEMYQEVGLATDFHAKKADRLTDSLSFGLNLDLDINDNLTMQFDVSNSAAKREANNGRGGNLALLGYANRVQWNLDNNILPYYSNFVLANDTIYSGQQEGEGVNQDPSQPGFVPAEGVADYLNTANSGAHVMIRESNEIENIVTQYKWDNVWLANKGYGFAEARFGIMYSSETKTVNTWNNTDSGIHCTYCNYQAFPDVSTFPQEVFDAGSDFLSDVSGSGRTPSRWLSFDGEALFDFLGNVANVDFDAVKTNNSFEVREKTGSLYLELGFEAEIIETPLYITAGFRYESTRVSVGATQANVEVLTILDATEMLPSYGPASAFTQGSRYHEILPNVSVKLEVTNELIARVAASRTLSHPILSSLRPITTLDTTRQGNLQSSSGNTALIPFSSDNLDLSLEWYYDDASYISGGYFRKYIGNFITSVKKDETFITSDGSLLMDPSTGTDVSAPDSADQVAVFTNTSPSNGEAAMVEGWEFAAQHTFESGYGLITNATIVASDAELDNTDITQVFALTGLSDSINLIAFYERGPFEGRLAYNWRDTFLQSLTQTGGDGVTYVEEYFQWDASASYDVTDKITIFVEGINLTEQYTHSRGRFSNQLLDIVDSGRRISIGVRGNL